MMTEWIFGVAKILNYHSAYGCVAVNSMKNDAFSKDTLFVSEILLAAQGSHVSHIFRKRSSYELKPVVNVLRKNSVRLAEVWLDDYKEKQILFLLMSSS